ncbi:hypothetical protein HHK36_005539 [Tetracentron sinense]|uniref:Protein kinase domain-containing protein n=1 Tax=Tetracentron sinense TaxID=13715 RepID=A0A834ZQJ4_TETSI|nr:hypothetical protein HHK36_005539 [Tetracentron sinense]
MEKLIRKLQFDEAFIKEPKGTAGGLGIMWKNSWKLHINSESDNIIQAQVVTKTSGKPWTISLVYGPAEAHKRSQFWTNLAHRSSPTDSHLWVGDFNEILHPHEKEGGKEKNPKQIADFRAFIQGHQLMDLGYQGNPFSWSNKRAGTASIRERLDRALCTTEWRQDSRIQQFNNQYSYEQGWLVSLLVRSWSRGLNKEDCITIKEMKGISRGLIIGISIGVIIGVLLAVSALFCFRYRRKRSQIGNSSSRRAAAIPIRANGVDSCTILSDSTIGQESPKTSEGNGISSWLEGPKKKNNVVSASGIPKYSYNVSAVTSSCGVGAPCTARVDAVLVQRIYPAAVSLDLQKATYNFTTAIGQGAFGPVYKAQMLTGEIVAVKVLATNSKQGEKEFQTEVLLLGRLHHRNLVNLVGFCAEKSQHMLVYVYMSNGSLASHLYSEKYEPLSWDLRVYIALDVARGLEYLHDGAVPPVVHRDIKSSNILLDQSMRARVADFGLSREEMVNPHASNVRGTFGYLDPEYISSRAFTKKSDVYSFGVLLFELIAGRNPQQGLMEYVELAAMNTEGRVGWEEIVDSRLDGRFDVQELNDVAALAYKCINRIPRKRPSMRDIVQALSRNLKLRHRKKHHKGTLSATAEEISIDGDQSETQIQFLDELQREESMDSTTDLPEV